MATTLWVTTNCNLNCKYCYEGDDKLNKVMSKETIERAIKFTLDNSKDKELTIPIHGGEPFLEFDRVKYIVKRFKEEANKQGKSVKFVTTTNATKLNNEITEFIVNEIPDVTVSIDGTKCTHDKMRPFKNGVGSHDIVLKNSLELLSHLPYIRVRMTFDSDSISNLYEDVKYLIDLGFKCIVPAPNLYDKNWEEVHVNTFENQIIKIKEYLSNFEDVLVSIADKNDYKIKGQCSGGRNGFHIYPDGNLYPCILAGGVEEFNIGNIYDGINEEDVDRILDYSSKENPECKGCTLYKCCDGPRCKIINKLVTNDYLVAPAIHCAFENILYKVNPIRAFNIN
ncbi:radical SAM/SPASM domain-containing protein [Paraclostridium sordellii]|uniref:radical SAM/SPASM domain-containing protein n=1 Tax=Paraclostridium sordellii TaxID=1505 RepID=UPI0005DAA6DC|nr:radical SAM protein [Paeniclostridium sordellii]CEN23627.1 radical SAM domain-containing protein [[Clostridium] sordellii] [Paeniclostridium sordellii]